MAQVGSGHTPFLPVLLVVLWCCPLCNNALSLLSATQNTRPGKEDRHRERSEEHTDFFPCIGIASLALFSLYLTTVSSIPDHTALYSGYMQNGAFYLALKNKHINKSFFVWLLFWIFFSFLATTSFYSFFPLSLCVLKRAPSKDASWPQTANICMCRYGCICETLKLFFSFLFFFFFFSFFFYYCNFSNILFHSYPHDLWCFFAWGPL